ncbi:MAG: HypC/HybG/HupF family hydrogenase formation chaperone [Phycisphaerae bacterium]|nr:HypC/HybG/HupF family hydrogenase formation chaperone [Phycisphaerae bacterium]
MCLAVPGKIIEIIHASDAKEPTDSATGATGASGATGGVGPLGVVDFQGSRVEASLAMTPGVGVGDWVLVHAGFAIAQLDDEEAQATFESIAEAMIEPENPKS